MSAQNSDFATGINSYPTQAEIDAPSNSVGFKNRVNEQGMCGFSDWRLPTRDELHSIVDYGTNFPRIDNSPFIDKTWFPNTKSSSYWTASPDVAYPIQAWYVRFSEGSSFTINRGGSFVGGYVRLVRAGL